MDQVKHDDRKSLIQPGSQEHIDPEHNSSRPTIQPQPIENEANRATPKHSLLCDQNGQNGDDNISQPDQPVVRPELEGANPNVDEMSFETNQYFDKDRHIQEEMFAALISEDIKTLDPRAGDEVPRDKEDKDAPEKVPEKSPGKGFVMNITNLTAAITRKVVQTHPDFDIQPIENKDLGPEPEMSQTKIPSLVKAPYSRENEGEQEIRIGNDIKPEYLITLTKNPAQLHNLMNQESKLMGTGGPETQEIHENQSVSPAPGPDTLSGILITETVKAEPSPKISPITPGLPSQAVLRSNTNALHLPAKQPRNETIIPKQEQPKPATTQFKQSLLGKRESSFPGGVKRPRKQTEEPVAIKSKPKQTKQKKKNKTQQKPEPSSFAYRSKKEAIPDRLSPTRREMSRYCLWVRAKNNLKARILRMKFVADSLAQDISDMSVLYRETEEKIILYERRFGSTQTPRSLYQERLPIYQNGLNLETNIQLLGYDISHNAGVDVAAKALGNPNIGRGMEGLQSVNKRISQELGQVDNMMGNMYYPNMRHYPAMSIRTIQNPHGFSAQPLHPPPSRSQPREQRVPMNRLSGSAIPKFASTNQIQKNDKISSNRPSMIKPKIADQQIMRSAQLPASLIKSNFASNSVPPVVQPGIIPEKVLPKPSTIQPPVQANGLTAKSLPEQSSDTMVKLNGQLLSQTPGYQQPDWKALPPSQNNDLTQGFAMPRGQPITPILPDSQTIPKPTPRGQDTLFVKDTTQISQMPINMIMDEPQKLEQSFMQLALDQHGNADIRNNHPYYNNTNSMLYTNQFKLNNSMSMNRSHQFSINPFKATLMNIEQLNKQRVVLYNSGNLSQPISLTPVLINTHNLYPRTLNFKGPSNNELNDLTPGELIPLMSGNPDMYVNIKFSREKRREKFKFSIGREHLYPALQCVLRHLLCAEHVTQAELDALNEAETEILKAFIMKKRLTSNKKSIVLEESRFKEICSHPGHKRNEENLKCVFKYALKFLRTQFRRKNPEYRFRKINKEMTQKNLVDLGFYTFYFGQVADNMRWPISKFFHPKVFSGNKNLSKSLDHAHLRPKTINKEYVENLKRSQKFMGDFTAYLQDTFSVKNSKTGIITQTKQIAIEKMMQKLDQWYKIMHKHKDNVENRGGLAVVLNDLYSNTKCKLPWSVVEMRKAVNDTKSHFDMV